jgi:tRNA threonylcarbamoyl adenosine modification protein YeaZ
VNDPLILALDTSGEPASVSLLRGRPPESRQVAGRRLPSGRSHTRALLRSVDECLEEADSQPADLSALVVGTGPGTFTGVRIGVAAARALALSLARPVLGVSSLSALAAAALAEARVPEEIGALVPLLDARRGQVFGTVYLAREGGGPGWIWTGEYFVSDPATVAAEVERRAAERRPLLLGQMGDNGMTALEVALHARHLLLGQEHLVPHSGRPSGLGLQVWLADEFCAPQSWGAAQPGADGTPEAVLPVYVRSPDADIHIRKMRDPWA